MYLKYCIPILFVLLLSLKSQAQCSTDGIVNIVDLVPTDQDILIDGAINVDLSGNQSLIGVLLEFEHTQVGDITIELTSPAGQTVILLGPIGSFGNTSLTDWEVLFVPCANTANPDPGFSATWSNNQDWGSLGNYNGSYHPFSGCLENFDTGSINGNWNIHILDNNLFDEGNLLSATLFFSDPAGLSCDNCTADAGVFSTSNISVCSSGASNIDLIPTFPNGNPGLENDYLYIIRQNDMILDVSPTPNLGNLPEGEYQICGISVLNSDVSTLETLLDGGYNNLLNNVNGQSPTICANINPDCVTAILSQSNIEVDLDVIVCAGDSYEIGNQTFDTAGEFQVIVPQPSGCDSIYNLDLTLSDIEAVVSTSSTTLDCSSPNIVLNSSTSTTTGTTQILWSSTGGNIDGDVNGNSIEVSEPGTYFLTLVDGFCESTTSIEIFANSDAAEISIIGGTITCNSPIVNIDLESNLPITNINWTGPSGFTDNQEDISVDEPGVYTATVESNNGCVSVKSVIINQAGSIPVLSLFAGEISCAEPLVSIIVSASDGSLTYEWTGPNGFTSDVQSPVVDEAGIYEVTATDNFGCSDIFQIEVIGNSSQFEFDIITENILCPDGRGTIQVIVDNPNAIVTITEPEGDVSIGNNLFARTVGTYEIHIISNGCEVTEEVVILEDISDVPVFNIEQASPIACLETEGILSLNTTSGAEFIDSISWTGPDGNIGDNNDITVGLVGTYFLEVHTSNGCVLEVSHELEFANDDLLVDIEFGRVNCENEIGFLAVVSNDDLQYSWEDDDGNITNDSIVTSSSENAYTLTITNSAGCSATYVNSITVDTIVNNPVLQSSNDISCMNSTSDLTFQFFRFSEFNWFDVDGNFISDETELEVDEAGEYFLALIDQSSLCADTISIIVELDTISPDLQAEDQSFDCLNNNLLVQVESTTENVTFSWTGPNGFMSNQKSPLVDVEGDYTVVVTGPNGCTSSETINLTSDFTVPDLQATFSNDLDCINTTTTLSATTSANDVSFLWIGPNNVFGQAEILVETPGIWQLIATGLNGCSDTLEVDVPFTGELPEFEALSDTLFCGETDLLIDLLEVTPDVTYEWTGPNGYSSDQPQNLVTESGLYILIGTATNNCVSRDTAFIEIDTLAPVISLNEAIDTLTCAQNMLDYSFTSDIELTFIEWTSSNSFNSQDSSITITESGDYLLSVVGKNNCDSEFAFEIEEDINEPVIDLANEDLNCDNQKADIILTNDDAGATYLWTGPNFMSDLQNIAAEEEGTYNVIVTGSNGCTLEEEVIVESDFVEPELVVGNDTLDCTGNPILLEATSSTDSVLIQWLGPDGFDSLGFNVLTDLPGEYFVIATGPNGCTTQEEISISDMPIFPDVNLEFSNSINCTDSMAVITAEVMTPVTSIEWETPSGIITDALEFTTEEAGFFVFTATGENSCITIDSIELEIDTLFPHVVVNQVGRILCEINNISINGEGSAIGPEFTYEWQTEDGNITFGENSLNPIIEGEGSYLLAIKDETNGCINTETLVVEREESTLESLDLEFLRQSCIENLDGEIIIQNVTGGVQPLRFALEGSSFTEDTQFTGLTAGEYIISVRDSFGCVLDSLVSLEEPFQVSVDLGEDLDVFLGEEVSVEADINLPLSQITTILWEPNSLVDCAFCTQFDFMPGSNTLLTARVTDENGCVAQDQIIIRVDDETKLYVPNIFTPNLDGVNDMFFIPESPNVALINSFSIYDRWGTEVFGDRNFVPGSGRSWDGTHMNRSATTGVYFYVAEVVMVNDEVRILRGNITLTR